MPRSVPGGWDKDAESWSQTRIYVNQGDESTSGEKDPTVELLVCGGIFMGPVLT